jgi:putative membrane protein insertion efficiency factor
LPFLPVADRSFSPRRGRGRRFALLGVLSWCLVDNAWAFELRGPEEAGRRVAAVEPVETSPLKIGMQGFIRLYQNVVSPVNPDRCGFRPSCSAYGSLAVREQGPFWGVLLTADRLLRCHFFKKPGPFTLLLPDGKILDLPPGKPLPESAGP